MSEIVKVQLALLTNDPRHRAGGGFGLVYAKGKRLLVEQPLPSVTVKALGSDVTGYFLAEHNGTSW